MILLLLLITLSPRDTFYELYQSGVEKMSDRAYQDAIEDLERAVTIRPESSENAKTYGVQMIPYHPYHQLAEAYLWTKDLEKADFYLQKAYEYGEDQSKNPVIQAKMEMVREFLNSLQSTRNPTTDNGNIDQTKPQMHLTPFIELILLDKYEEAAEALKLLSEANPNHPTVTGLQNLLGDFVSNRKALEETRADNLAKLQEFLDTAREQEEQGNLEAALHFYMALEKADPDHPEASAGVTRVRKKLEEKGHSEADIQAELERIQGEKLELTRQIQALASRTKDLVEQNKGHIKLLQEMREREEGASPPPGEVEVNWVLQEVDIAEMTSNIRASIQSSVDLEKATLLINGKTIETWPLSGKRRTSIPPLLNYPMESYRNQIELRITDANHHTYSREMAYNIPKPKQLISPNRGKTLLLSLALLAAVLYAMQQQKRRKAFRERFNPYIAGAPVLNENMFYGRLPLLKQILNTLHNNSLMVYGERRIGKTSFLHRLNAVLPHVEDEIYEFIPVIIDLQGVKEEDFFHTIDHEIALVLEPRGISLEDPPDHLPARKFISRLRTTIKHLKEHCEKKPKLVLLLDEVDIMNGFSEQTNQQLRSVFMKGFADHIVAVMAGIHINTQWKSEGSPWYNFFEQIELKPFSKNHATALITRPVNGVYQYTDEAVAKIMEITGGKPYLIQKMCLNLIAHILIENRRKVTVEDVMFVFSEIKNEFFGDKS